VSWWRLSFHHGEILVRLLRGFDELVPLIKPNSNVILHSGFSEPNTLTKGLAEHANDLRDVVIFSLMPMGSAPYAYAGASISVKTFFPGRGLRRAVNSGSASLLRMPLSKVGSCFSVDRNLYRPDFLFLQLSPPDEFGQMTLGITVDYMREVLARDPIVVAEIAPSMPRTVGNTVIHSGDVDFIIESSGKPETMEAHTSDQVDQKIADNIAELVKSGAVLQTGIGSLPDSVYSRLSHLHDLGIHTGIMTDAVVPLIKSGVVTNSAKTPFRGRSVTTMAGGSQEFYDFLNCNKLVEFHASSVTHSFDVLTRIDNFCAINSVIELDLLGRANGETADGRVIAAPGGLPDFATGAARGRNGCSIVALRSTANAGARNNIRAQLDGNAPVTVGADSIDFVVTEHGIAKLRGLTTSAIAHAIIEVADPGYRQELRQSQD
jgi:4-hydroxybutyrate CoA-transferase